MKNNEINIRDPFVRVEEGTYYMFATFADGLRGTYVLKSDIPDRTATDRLHLKNGNVLTGHCISKMM